MEPPDKKCRTKRCTEHPPVARLLRLAIARMAGVAPRAGVRDRGRSEK
jgi:hypothetical protein